MGEQLTHISSTTWNEVLADWREREADLWGWEAHWKAKGFSSWDAWRETFYTKLDLPHKEWNLYNVSHPSTFVPAMWAVAFNGWRSYYKEGVTRATFKDLVDHQELANNKKVTNLLNDFPGETTVIVLRNENQFAVFEGMHRCSAIALAQKQGRVIHTNLTAAITDVDAETFRRVTTQE